MAKKLKWGTIEYLNVLIDEYFETAKVPNIAGLCLTLNISKETWCYYSSNKWKTHRLKDEELEEKLQEQEEKHVNGIMEEIVELSPKTYQIEEFNQVDRRENEPLKSQVSDSFKKAALRLESFVMEEMFTAKNPAGAIFYAKAALGYRETAPEATEQANRLPTTINIVVLPQPERPKQLDTIPATTYSILPDKSTD